MSNFELTKEEEKVVRALNRLEKIWPDTLWLFSANRSLCVMRCGENGEHVMLGNGGVDPDYIVRSFLGIDNDGGDW